MPWKQEGTVKSPGVSADAKEERERTVKEGTIKSPGVSVDAKEEKGRTSQSCKNKSLLMVLIAFFRFVKVLNIH